MKFLADKTVNWNHLLITLRDYLKIDDFSNWSLVLVDPGVYDLGKSDTYKWENELNIEKFIETLPENHYFSFDYPPRFNLKYEEDFIWKTYINAWKYHKYSNYIITVQSKWQNYWDFTQWFDMFNSIPNTSGIMGLGVGGTTHLTQYLKHILDYAFKHTTAKWIHTYGLCLRAIPYAEKLGRKFNIKYTTDTTKWTRACTDKLKKKYGLNCNTKNRQEFFDTYIEQLIKKGCIIEY